MFRQFRRYVAIGLFNTGLHWMVFLLLCLHFQMAQAPSNLLAFCVAVSFSFFANARINFRVRPSGWRYVLFTGFLGSVSLLIGNVADHLTLPPMLTLVLFSSFSLAVGFFFSKFVVFRSA
ncbi:GtrA family protein [Pseudomonas akapageensis]|uniref:GtrA family protein n=1 Tax=Pseudomonas akapageensis TaxID=2609961 RepID=UPI0014081B71|nr:GtrA family protein [Pseudomonas akapageensis]